MISLITIDVGADASLSTIFATTLPIAMPLYALSALAAVCVITDVCTPSTAKSSTAVTVTICGIERIGGREREHDRHARSRSQIALTVRVDRDRDVRRRNRLQRDLVTVRGTAFRNVHARPALHDQYAGRLRLVERLGRRRRVRRMSTFASACRRRAPATATAIAQRILFFIHLWLARNQHQQPGVVQIIRVVDDRIDQTG